MLTTKFGLFDAQGSADTTTLTSLSWIGRIDGLLMTWTAAQRYRNTSRSEIEVVYTFPLAWSTVVTEFAAVVNGSRLVARPLERPAAEAVYEKAIGDGDTPLMLECSDPSNGVATANLGNLRPGDEVELRISFARVLTLMDETVRADIPTVVAPRYSGRGGQGGLLPHERVVTSLAADYPASARITVSGPLARARIECQNHRTAVRQTPAGELEISIPQCAPDRDLALLFTGVAPFGEAVFAEKDGKAAGLVTTILPRRNEAGAAHVRVLVDCSGSMCGLSIQKAREAVAALASSLRPEDTLTLTAFGSDHRHLIGRPVHVTASVLRRDVMPAILSLDSDMGGTRMEEAVNAVLELGDEPADILLVTDGQVWDAERIVRAAGAGGKRIFVVGVGTSPASTLLHRIAQATGGFCEVTMPSEDMSGTTARMLCAMRGGAADFPEPVGRQFPGVSAAVFVDPGEFSFSDFPRELVTPAAWRTIPGIYEAIVKLGALKRAAAAGDESAARRILVENGVLSPFVSFIMVHERAAEDKASGAPQLRRIAQMVAREAPAVSAAPSMVERQADVCEAPASMDLSMMKLCACTAPSKKAAWERPMEEFNPFSRDDADEGWSELDEDQIEAVCRVFGEVSGRIFEHEAGTPLVIADLVPAEWLGLLLSEVAGVWPLTPDQQAALVLIALNWYILDMDDVEEADTMEEEDKKALREKLALPEALFELAESGDILDIPRVSEVVRA